MASKNDPEREFDKLKAEYLDARTKCLRLLAKGCIPCDDLRRHLQEAAFHLAEYFCSDAS